MVRYHFFSDNQHAVVLGAGVDGLLAARVLTEYFQRVTVVSEETLPAEPGLPQDVWQALPMHAFGVQGARNLERLFPGLTAELMTAGAPTVEWTADAPALLPGGWSPRFHSDLISRPVTLNLLRHVIRQRLLDYGSGRVSFLENRSIRRLKGHTIIHGVILRHASQEETLTADLVVDATGRRACLPEWLGWLSPVACTLEPARRGLAVRLFRRPPGYQPGWQALLVCPRQDQPGAVLMPVENGQWLVMLVTDCADVPANEADFMQLARRAATPVLYEALQRALPLTPVFHAPAGQAVRWHTEQARNWPEGLIVTGAAALAFHPALGLDVTSATAAALALREALDDQRKHQPQGHLTGLARRFHHRQARAFALPWKLWTMRDHPAAGAYSSRLMHWYGEHILKGAHSESQLLHSLLAAGGLVDSPRALLKLAVLRDLLRRSHPQALDSDHPPAFEPVTIHKTITQEIAAVAHLKDL